MRLEVIVLLGGGSEFKYVDINFEISIIEFNGVQYEYDVQINGKNNVIIRNTKLFNDLAKDIKPIIITDRKTGNFIIAHTTYLLDANMIDCIYNVPDVQANITFVP